MASSIQLGDVTMDGIFDRNGLARLDDLETEQWRSLFNELEALQTDFLSAKPHPPEYTWPKDPLHTWSRVWEYPYVLYHLRKWRNQWSVKRTPRVLDFGSGATFFPFAVARQGFDVVCLDNNPVCGQGIECARKRVNHTPGDVSFRLSNSPPLPVESASIDVLYSISVLEHLPDASSVIEEFARVLAPSGLLILTFDIVMEPEGKLGLDADERERFLSRLSPHFDMSHPSTFLHPATVLTSLRGPYPMFEKERGLHAVWRVTKEEILKPILRRRRRTLINICCEGLIARKHAPGV